MVTDQELARYVESLLRQPAEGAVTLTVDGVVRQLEAKLGLNLAHKAAFIRDQIGILIGGKEFFTAAGGAAVVDPRVLPQFHHPGFLPPGQHTPLASPYASLPSGHDISFVYPAPPPATASTAASAATGVVDGGSLILHESGTKRKTKRTPAGGGKRRGGPGGLNKLCVVSPELQTIVGEPTMARTEIVKQLWAYIRKNNLQDPNNRRKIVCNDELRLVFETDCTDMFKMNKLLAKHIKPLENPESVKKAKTEPTDCSTSANSSSEARPVILSCQLADFFGTGETEMLQSEALSRIWSHIKSHQLEDPANAAVILCDEKLRRLFGCESVSSAAVSEMLSHHLFNRC